MVVEFSDALFFKLFATRTYRFFLFYKKVRKTKRSDAIMTDVII